MKEVMQVRWVLAAPMGLCEQQGVACNAYIGSRSEVPQPISSDQGAQPPADLAHEVSLAKGSSHPLATLMSFNLS